MGNDKNRHRQYLPDTAVSLKMGSFNTPSIFRFFKRKQRFFIIRYQQLLKILLKLTDCEKCSSPSFTRYRYTPAVTLDNWFHIFASISEIIWISPFSTLYFMAFSNPERWHHIHKFLSTLIYWHHNGGQYYHWRLYHQPGRDEKTKIIKIQEEQVWTLVIVTHSNELAKEADIVFNLRKGELMISDTPDTAPRKGRHR